MCQQLQYPVDFCFTGLLLLFLSGDICYTQVVMLSLLWLYIVFSGGSEMFILFFPYIHVCTCGQRGQIPSQCIRLVTFFSEQYNSLDRLPWLCIFSMAVHKYFGSFHENMDSVTRFHGTPHPCTYDSRYCFLVTKECSDCTQMTNLGFNCISIHKYISRQRSASWSSAANLLDLFIFQTTFSPWSSSVRAINIFPPLQGALKNPAFSFIILLEQLS